MPLQRRIACLVIQIAAAFVAGGGSAAPLMGPVTVTASNPGDQFTPAVARDAEHDRWLAVWSQDVSGVRAIVGRLVNEDGFPIGDSFFITDSAVDELSPDVVYDPGHDRYLVVWEHDYSAVDPDIWGRFIPWYGPVDTLLPFVIESPSSLQQSPALEYAPFPIDEFMVVWGDRATLLDPPTIRAKRLAPDTGSGIGSSFEVVGDATYGRQNPQLAWNPPAGRFLVVYERFQVSGGLNLDVYAASLSYSGTVFSPDLGLAGYPEEESQVGVAACDGRWMVVWKGGQGTAGHPYARPVADDLSLGATTDLYPVGYSSWPAVQCNPFGAEFFVVWQQLFGSGHSGVVGAFASPQGVLVDRFNVNVAPVGDERDFTRPAVSVGSYERRALVVWEADRADLAHVDLGDRWVDMALFSDGFESGNTTRWSATTP